MKQPAPAGDDDLGDDEEERLGWIVVDELVRVGAHRVGDVAVRGGDDLERQRAPAAVPGGAGLMLFLGCRGEVERPGVCEAEGGGVGGRAEARGSGGGFLISWDTSATWVVNRVPSGAPSRPSALVSAMASSDTSQIATPDSCSRRSFSRKVRRRSASRSDGCSNCSGMTTVTKLLPPWGRAQTRSRTASTIPSGDEAGSSGIPSTANSCQPRRGSTGAEPST